jgi:hypothetical protein
MGLPAISSNEATLSLPANVPALREVPALPAKEAKGYLLSPSADFWLLGGASAAFLFLCHFALKHENPSPQASWFIFNLSFLANFPHFLSSYHMLYGDFRKEIFAKPRYFWAAVIVPCALFGLMGAGVAGRNLPILGGLANAMFFFVGWHYCKQTFGVMIVSNALRKVYYTKPERWALKANLLFIWMVSWTRFALPDVGYSFQGFPYRGFGLPPVLETIANIGMVASALLVVGLHGLKYVREGKVPAAGAIVGWVAFQAWYIPAAQHPAFALTIPFFHSLQYLMFVIAFRRSKAKAQAGSLAEPAGRARFVKSFYGQLLLAACTGALFMWFIPKGLDRLQLAQIGWYQPTLFFNCFTIFINIHHYFIDNVLWRSDNPEMREHLF